MPDVTMINYAPKRLRRWNGGRDRIRFGQTKDMPDAEFDGVLDWEDQARQALNYDFANVLMAGMTVDDTILSAGTGDLAAGVNLSDSVTFDIVMRADPTESGCVLDIGTSNNGLSIWFEDGELYFDAGRNVAGDEFYGPPMRVPQDDANFSLVVALDPDLGEGRIWTVPESSGDIIKYRKLKASSGWPNIASSSAYGLGQTNGTSFARPGAVLTPYSGTISNMKVYSGQVPRGF